MAQFIPKEWLLAEALVCGELVDPVSGFMHEMGSQGVTINDEETLALVTAYFSTDLPEKDREDLIAYIDRLSDNFPEFPRPILTFRTILSENWAVAWKDNFRIMEVGTKVVVTPPWLSPDSTKRHVIVIEPAEAFGTGSHETTQGCLELLEECLDEQKSEALSTNVLDVGCGSGILAIASVKLGSDSVTAIDNDPVAIASAIDNASLNQVMERIIFECRGIETASGKYNIVIANLDAMTLIRNVSILKDTFVDKLIISGVTVDQWASLKDIFEKQSLKLIKELRKTEWVSAVFMHEMD